MNDTTSYMLLGDLLEALGKEGFLFRTQGIEGDEYVLAEEIMADLRHGDMAEMLAWRADWNSDTLNVTVTAPNDAIESPGVLVEFHAQRVSRNVVKHNS